MRCGRQRAKPSGGLTNIYAEERIFTVHKKYAMRMLECGVRRAHLIVANARCTMTQPFFLPWPLYEPRF